MTDKETAGSEENTNIVRAYEANRDGPLFPTLKDVAGSQTLKTELEEIVNNIDNADVFRMLGVEPEKSYMFQGPPGTGKTFGLHSIVNELRSKTRRIFFVEYSIGKFGTAYINMGAKNMQTFFDKTRETAEENNVDALIYWFDEAEVILGKRGAGTNVSKEDDKLLDTLMKNMQYINSSDYNHFIFFATNHPQVLDDAATRSGRVDKIINFDLPDEDALRDAYGSHLSKIESRYKAYFPGAQEDIMGSVDLDEVVSYSNKFNYPDVELVVNNAVRRIAKEVIKSTEDAPTLSQITTDRLVDEARRVYEQKYKDKPSPVGFDNF